MTDVILEVRELRKGFRAAPWRGPVPALCGVSFTVAAGQCYGCLGRNGAGKTTTLKVLTGQVLQDSGEALLFRRPAADPAARRRVGYVPENPWFHEHLTPEEGLEMFARLGGVPRSERRRRIPVLLERVGLAEAGRRRLRGFSKGMRQRYGLAAALVAEPELLLLDEPLSGLDPAGRQLVKELILEEHRAGRTILMSSHVLADVQELCERVVVLDRGRVVREGALEELLTGEARAFELRFRGAPAEFRERVQARARRFHVQGDAVSAVLAGPQDGPALAAEAVRRGAELLALVPERESLEAWFVRLTAEAPVEPLLEEEEARA